MIILKKSISKSLKITVLFKNAQHRSCAYECNHEVTGLGQVRSQSCDHQISFNYQICFKQQKQYNIIKPVVLCMYHL